MTDKLPEEKKKRKRKPLTLQTTVSIPSKEDGEFVSYCLNLPGAVSCGDSQAEALENLREAVEGCIESYLDAGERIPWIEPSSSKDEYDFAEWIDVDV